MTKIPEFGPSNRTGRPPLGELILVAGGTYWFVDDIDSNDNPRAYGSPDSTYRILPDRKAFIICSDRGSFVKCPPRRGESNGRVRRFVTAIAAAEFAMSEEA